jgi:hypothetical protein
MRIRLIRIRFALNSRVYTYYCKSELSEEVLGRNLLELKKVLTLACVNFLLVFHFCYY